MDVAGCSKGFCGSLPAPPLPEALLAELQANYSLALYGAAARVQPHRMRVLWPALLSRSVRAALRVACRVPMRHTEDGAAHFWLAPPKNMLQTRALWVQQPPDSLVARRHFSSDAWVEVAHCYYSSERVSSHTPTWFYELPGSGLSLNIGRTLRLDEAELGAAFAGRVHVALTRGSVAYAAALLGGASSDALLSAPARSRLASALGGANLTEFDSVQFPLRGTPSWGAERYTEIVMIGWVGGEAGFVTSRLEQLRCGRSPHLRRCGPSDPAVLQQGPACIRAMSAQPEVAELLRLNHCAGADGARFAPAERIADREAARLRRRYNVSLVDPTMA